MLHLMGALFALTVLAILFVWGACVQEYEVTNHHWNLLEVRLVTWIKKKVVYFKTNSFKLKLDKTVFGTRNFFGGFSYALRERETKEEREREENFSYFSWFVHDLLQHLTKILCLAPSTFLFRLFLGFGPIFVLLFGILFEHRFLCALFLKNSFLLICGGYCRTLFMEGR